MIRARLRERMNADRGPPPPYSAGQFPQTAGARMEGNGGVTQQIAEHGLGAAFEVHL